MTADSFQQKAKTPDNPLSLFEGFAGAVCYLNDLMNPRAAEFPLMDVFLYEPWDGGVCCGHLDEGFLLMST